MKNQKFALISKSHNRIHSFPYFVFIFTQSLGFCLEKTSLPFISSTEVEQIKNQKIYLTDSEIFCLKDELEPKLENEPSFFKKFFLADLTSNSVSSHSTILTIVEDRKNFFYTPFNSKSSLNFNFALEIHSPNFVFEEKTPLNLLLSYSPSTELSSWVKENNLKSIIGHLVQKFIEQAPSVENSSTFFSVDFHPNSQIKSLIDEGKVLSKVYLQMPKNLQIDLESSIVLTNLDLGIESFASTKFNYDLTLQPLAQIDVKEKPIHLDLEIPSSTIKPPIEIKDKPYRISTSLPYEKILTHAFVHHDPIEVVPLTIKDLQDSSFDNSNELFNPSKESKPYVFEKNFSLEVEKSIASSTKALQLFPLEDQLFTLKSYKSTHETKPTIKTTSSETLFSIPEISIKSLDPVLTKNTSSINPPIKEPASIIEQTVFISVILGINKNDKQRNFFNIPCFSLLPVSINRSQDVKKADLSFNTALIDDLYPFVAFESLDLDFLVAPLTSLTPLAQEIKFEEKFDSISNLPVKTKRNSEKRSTPSPQLQSDHFSKISGDVKKEKSSSPIVINPLQLTQESLLKIDQPEEEFFAFFKAYQQLIYKESHESPHFKWSFFSSLKGVQSFQVPQTTKVIPHQLISLQKITIDNKNLMILPIEKIPSSTAFSYTSLLKNPMLEEPSLDSSLDFSFPPLPKEFYAVEEKISGKSFFNLVNTIEKFPEIYRKNYNFIALLEKNEEKFDPNDFIYLDKMNQDFDFTYHSLLKKRGLDYLTLVPSLKELNTYVLSTEFRNEVEVIASPDGNYYYFSVKFIPYYPEDLRKIPQNVFFVLDQSRTISEERFEAFKKGILRSIPYLHKDAQFNIIVLNKHCDMMNQSCLYNDKESIELAKNFLDKISYGFIVSNQEYTKAIDYIESKFDLDSNHLNTIILLSDGAYYKDFHQDHEKISNICKKNKNLFQLYTVTASQDNYLGALDMIAFHNHGNLLYSKTNVALPRQLAILVKNLKNPIASQLFLSAIRNESNTVEFFSRPDQMPAFFADQPFVIYGKTDRLQNIDLMLQGKVEAEWINISQTINLRQAKPGDRELLRTCQTLEKKLNYFTDKDNNDET
jgi:hypothetical protein